MHEAAKGAKRRAADNANSEIHRHKVRQTDNAKIT